MIHVTLVFSPAAREVVEEKLVLPPDSCVGDAVRGSGLDACFPSVDWQTLTPGVWGRVVTWAYPLQQGDRIELCRLLRVDPKVARRERFSRQGARGAGLFTKRRIGAKAGY